MSFKVIILFSAMVAMVMGHGRVIDPPHRGWAWRLGFGTPAEYTDHENFCGGFAVQYQENGGKCGICGDNYASPQPRKNENGGELGTGTVVKTYKAGSEIEVHVQLTASHMGHFEFSLCPLNSPKELETEECFNAHKLQLADGSGTQYKKIDTPRYYKVKLVLPKGLTCEHCAFRWHYRTGNSAGYCEDGSDSLGCGDQEIFRTCSDIRIV